MKSSSIDCPTWSNSRDARKTIDYILVLSNLVSAVVGRNVLNVGNYFNTDHYAVSVSFKDAMAANATVFSDNFTTSKYLLDLDVMRKWFKSFNGVFTKKSSNFHKLKLLVSKITKAFYSLDNIKTSIVQEIVNSDVGFDRVCSAFFSSLQAKESRIRLAINKQIENFVVNKDNTIRSMLKCSFQKVVLDYLVIGDKLILEPNLVKAKINIVMEDWTRKCNVPLEYVFDDAFSNVMCLVSFDKLLRVVSNLSNGKAAGFSEVSNKLWKHCDKLVLDMLLVFLNSCLFHESWREVAMNTRPIALIKTTCKILSKILLNKISLAYSFFDVLYRDNFLVLKGTTMQSPIFAIGLVIENALEKNYELWLVLQDMQKTYNSVSWKHLRNSLVRIKMCDKFIRFFDNIHNNCVNRVEVFSLLLWCIFYDPLLCKVKRQESIYGYRLNSYFVAKIGRLESQTGLTSFLTASAFVNNTIWIGSSQAATQHILDIASEFFKINDISINNNKTVVIPINCKVTCPNLSISSLHISIVKRGEFHHYLGIFLSTKDLSKPSLAKANADVRFFANLVLRKTISDKHYKTQFSFVPISMCDKWNSLIRRGLKLKFGLPLDFSNDVFYHLSLYGLKTFEQVQAKSKIASISPLHLLVSPVCIKVSASNNFLAGVVCIFLGCGLSLSGHVNNSFHFYGRTPMFSVLGKTDYFKLFVDFFNSVASFSACFSSVSAAEPLDILESSKFGLIYNQLLGFGANCFSVYIDRSLKGLESVDIKAGTVVFFENISLGLGVKVSGLMFSTLAELQTIVLAAECVPPNSSVSVFTDSQAALDACKSELDLVEVSDYAFSCMVNNSVCCCLLDAHTTAWDALSGLSISSSSVSLLLSSYASNVMVCTALCKRFVFKEWLREAIFVFGDMKLAGWKVVEFVRNLCLAFRDKDSLALASVSELSAMLSMGVVRLLSIAEAIGVSFGSQVLFIFFRYWGLSLNTYRHLVWF
ncbi:hypothetical protein G9A89_015002 [Geosiphon pyriformis]|nr:hypothetical protein G9A89_015002 [Geosiphon pyriformis]